MTEIEHWVETHPRIWAGWPDHGIHTMEDAIDERVRIGTAPGIPSPRVVDAIVRETIRRRRCARDGVSWPMSRQENAYLAVAQAIDAAVNAYRSERYRAYKARVDKAMYLAGESQGILWVDRKGDKEEAA